MRPRRQHALNTKRRILDAAYNLFCARGYQATTMSAIGEAAGVAVQTVYFTFHRKAELMTQLITATGGGNQADIPVMDRQWALDALAADDGRGFHLRLVEIGDGVKQPGMRSEDTESEQLG